MNGNKTIMCNMINNVLIPSPTGQIIVNVQDSIGPDQTRGASIHFGGEIKAFITYGVTGNRPVGYMVTSDDPMGYVASSVEQMLPFL